MAGNTQMNDNERGIFSIHGITGMLVAVVLLLSILVVLTINGIKVQQNEATNFYKVNQDLKGLTSGSTFSDFKQKSPAEQNENYILVNEKK